MKKLTPFFLILISLIYSLNVSSQEKTVFGSVTTFDIIPVIQAEVYVKSSKQTFYSDSLGNFSVLCEKKDKIKISAVGFYTKNIKVDDQTDTLSVDLKIKPQGSDLVVRSGHVKDEARLMSTMQLDDEDEDFSLYTDINELLENRFPNVIVEDGGIIIGSRSNVGGSDYALVVVDGIISDFGLNIIKPQEIKKIEILKPGGESAIYGSRGGNGVLKITTKTGGDFN